MKPTKNYDSADSYASTFIFLVTDYYCKTQDKHFVRANLEDINLVAQVIVELQDKDGLVFVKPGSRTKYLMDNAENYRGLMDWSQVLEEEGYVDEAIRLRHVSDRIKAGIMDTFTTLKENPLRGLYLSLADGFPDVASGILMEYLSFIS